jgi:hypothetical protein
LPGFVRRLPSYYAEVRLLWIVHRRLRLLAFPLRTIHPRTGWVANPEISRFPNKEHPCMPGSQTTPGRLSARITRSSVLPSGTSTPSAPGILDFRGSMAGLHAPLPTLRRHPRGCLRTAWGRCGLLALHRGGLSPPTPCRSPGALSVSNPTEIVGFSTKNLLPAGNINRPVTILGAE